MIYPDKEQIERGRKFASQLTDLEMSDLQAYVLHLIHYEDIRMFYSEYYHDYHKQYPHSTSITDKDFEEMAYELDKIMLNIETSLWSLTSDQAIKTVLQNKEEKK